MYKYSIKKDDKDPMKVVILQEGIEAEFTLQELKDSEKRADSVIEELEAQKNLEEAKMQNVVNNYGDLFKDGKLVSTKKEIEKAVAITLFTGTEQKVKDIDAKLKDFAKAKKQMQKDLKDIKEQTGVEMLIESPYGEEQ